MIELLPVDIVLRIAHSQLYVREIGGPNQGPAVQQYQAVTGNKPPAAWCMSFVLWCLKVGLDRVPLRLSGRVQDVYESVDKRVLYDKPKRGDMFLKWYPSLNRYAHTGFVYEELVLGAFNSIEGNGNANGGREGYGVISRPRATAKDASKYIYLRWSELL